MLYLQISECAHCDVCSFQGNNPTCSHRYAYWSEVNNYDYPHSTGISEQEARADALVNPKAAYWVNSADNA